MNRFERKLPVAYRKPGEMYFAELSTLLATVLGSCMSITMFSIRAGGAICHGLLPPSKGQLQCGRDGLDGFKYVDCSIRRMAV